MDPPYKPGEPVAIFVPCYMDQFYPEAGEAMVRVLERQGVKVVFPAGQTCCGQPAFNSGYWEESRPVIRQFCKVFESFRWIVCPSGSCTSMCRVFFPARRFRARKSRRVSRRVFEFSEFLVDVLGVTDTGATFSSQGDVAHGLPRPARVGRLRSSAEAARIGSRPDLLRACRTSRNVADSAARSA